MDNKIKETIELFKGTDAFELLDRFLDRLDIGKDFCAFYKEATEQEDKPCDGCPWLFTVEQYGPTGVCSTGWTESHRYCGYEELLKELYRS